MGAGHPVRRRRRAGLLCSAAGAVLVLAGVGTTLAAPDNPNSEEYWEALGHGECTKTDGVDAPTFTLGAPPPGRSWTLLVLKAASPRANGGGGDEVVADPVPGVYGHTSGHDLSHVIVCSGVADAVSATTQPTTPQVTEPPETTQATGSTEPSGPVDTTATEPTEPSEPAPPSGPVDTTAPGPSEPAPPSGPVDTTAPGPSEPIGEASSTVHEGTRPPVTHALAPPTTTGEPAPPVTLAGAPTDPVGELPFTGPGAGPLTAIGIALLLAGGAIVLADRRVTRANH